MDQTFEQQKNILVICGPTASGKTRLAVLVACAVSGEIISADSRQVYRGMDLGTGKDLAEYATARGIIPYHLIDITDPRDTYTVVHFQQDCYAAFEQIRGRGRLPIMTGGTGLYIEAVLKHYRIPNVPEDADLRRMLMQQDKETLIARLKQLDPVVFIATDCSSKKRVVRGLEIALCGQRQGIQWGREDPPRIDPLVLCVRWNRAQLHERINLRLQQRLACGMVDEVRYLLAQNISPERFALFGMEYKHVARYLQGDVSYERMVTDLQTDIHHLAKRQETWFRGMEKRGVEIHWVDEAREDIAMDIIRKHPLLTKW